MSKRDYQDWLDSLPEDHEDYPQQDDLTEEELRARAEELPETPTPSEEELDAIAKEFGSDRPTPL